MVPLVPDTTNPKVIALMKPHSDWFLKMMLPNLCRLERRKVLIGDNLSSHLSDAVYNQSMLSKQHRFYLLISKHHHLLQPLDVAWFSFKKAWRKTLEDWKRSPQGLRYKGCLPKGHFNKLLKTLISIQT